MLKDICPPGVLEFLVCWKQWLFEEVFVLSSFYQLAAIAWLVLMAYPLAILLEKRVVLPLLRGFFPDESELRTFEKKIVRVAWPVMATVLLGLARLLAHKNQWDSDFIVLAMRLTLAWVVIRLLTSFLFEEYWAKVVAVIIWTVVALDLAKFLLPIISILDRVGFSLQNQRITPLHVIKGVALLVLFIALANRIIAFFAKKIQKSEHLKPAVQVLVVKISTIALYIVVILITMDAVGLDLNYLLVLGGALGLGLGLGLQKVASNLVSGFILLMDNSIRPGDVIEVEGVYGWIDSLNARYISMITRDGTAYLVPNEQFMTNMVINWSFTEKGLRLKIPVGISYGSDVRRAMQLMEEVAEKLPRILKNPKPGARLIGFGDSSIDLELRAWIKDPARGVVNIKSEIQLGIWDAFHENNIDFPFPQRDFHLKTAPELTIQVKEGTTLEDYGTPVEGNKIRD
jgi:small-conductance mechanosensitive channel